jgi:DeoR family transcriptional regulator, aga operon transcriptional repressor
MLEALRRRDFMRVAEFRALFGVSEVTVRSDLDVLARRGAIRRIRGGAIARTAPRTERPFEESESTRAEEKEAIGRAAAALVAGGETIILDVGTTTAAVARALVERDDLHEVTVFTSGLNVALALERATPRLTVVVTGGTLRPLQHSLVNPLGELLLQNIHADTAFVGCNGVDAQGGVTNINIPEAEIKRRMLVAARRRVVVADGSKIGDVAFARLCPIGEIDALITGDSADAAALADLRARGVEVRVTP